MRDHTVLLSKWCTPRGIILAKGQFGHSYTFGTMLIMILSPVSNFGDQSLCKVRESDIGLSFLVK